MYKVLESSKKYNFKILASEFNEFYLNILTSNEEDSTYKKILMAKDGDYFIRNDVVLYKGYLQIGFMNSDNFYRLVRYTITSD